ncbi:MAG: zinc-dependent alcohol dehydrogenase family protein [Anaerolineales bacterium]|jgi:NADPH2:quinone reductase
MKAMVMKDFGGPEVFEEKEVPTPEPGPNELLVKVQAASVNPVDLKIRQAGSWAGVKPPAIIGYDVSGVVEAAGPGVKDFQVGDDVYYTPEIFSGQGSYAEYHVANEAIAARKPANISHVEAASIPLAGGTAWDALAMRARIRVGDTILIHGAGGVGSLAIQIAKAAGARVFVSCSDYMVDLAKELGAEKAFNYKSEDFVEAVLGETNDQGVDMVVDTVGGDLLTRSLQVVRPFGIMVGIVGTDTGLRAAFRKNITVHYLFLIRARYKLDDLRNLIERDLLKPVIDSVLPLSQVAEAHRRLKQGGIKGKIVLQVA